MIQPPRVGTVELDGRSVGSVDCVWGRVHIATGSGGIGPLPGPVCHVGREEAHRQTVRAALQTSSYIYMTVLSVLFAVWMVLTDLLGVRWRGDLLLISVANRNCS